MASATHASAPASTLPEWVPEQWASKQTSRGSIDALHLLADMALFDHRAPYTSTRDVDTPSSAPQRRPSSPPSSASSSTSTSPATSCRNSAASTPATSVASTPCSGTKGLPEVNPGELTASLNALAAPKKPRKSVRFSTRGPESPSAPVASRRSSRIAQSTASVTWAKKRKRADGEDEEKLTKSRRTEKLETASDPEQDPESAGQSDYILRLTPGKATCKICSSTICDSNWEVERHLGTHLPDSEKPFHCPHCPHAGVQRSNMRIHVENKHPDLPNPFAQPRARSRSQ